MNKIIIDNENYIEIKDNVVSLEILVNNLTLKIKGKVLINEISLLQNESLDLTLDVEPNTSLVYNRFALNNSINNKIKIIQDKNSSVTFNYSLLVKDDSKISFDSKLLNVDNKAFINIKGITEDKGKLKIDSNGESLSNTNENELFENIKILTFNDEQSSINPNLLIASNGVIVNHAATLSSISKDELFYLNSKGISNEVAASLVKKGFLLSNLDIDDNFQNKVKSILEGDNK